jgi:hypothetical protein
MAAGRQVSVDFTGVEVGFASVKIPEGDYGLKIASVKQRKSEAGNNCLVFGLKTVKGPSAGIGKTIPHNCVLTSKSLWNLRNLLEATGKQVPSKAIKIDLDKLVGLTLAGTVIDDEYEGKKKSVVSAFFPMADLNNGEEGERADETEEAGDEEGESAEEGGESDEELFE